MEQFRKFLGVGYSHISSGLSINCWPKPAPGLSSPRDMGLAPYCSLGLCIHTLLCPPGTIPRGFWGLLRVSPTLFSLSLLLHSGSAPQTPAAALMLPVPQTP